MSGCVRRAFPFRIDMRAIQCSRELTIVQNRTWGTSLEAKNCARTHHAGLSDRFSTAEPHVRQGIFAIKSPAIYRAAKSTPLFLFWLDP
jgi:hypothetical protein